MEGSWLCAQGNGDQSVSELIAQGFCKWGGHGHINQFSCAYHSCLCSFGGQRIGKFAWSLPQVLLSPFTIPAVKGIVGRSCLGPFPQFIFWVPTHYFANVSHFALSKIVGWSLPTIHFAPAVGYFGCWSGPGKLNNCQRSSPRQVGPQRTRPTGTVPRAAAPPNPSGLLPPLRRDFCLKVPHRPSFEQPSLQQITSPHQDPPHLPPRFDQPPLVYPWFMFVRALEPQTLVGLR